MNASEQELLKLMADSDSSDSEEIALDERDTHPSRPPRPHCRSLPTIAELVEVGTTCCQSFGARESE